MLIRVQALRAIAALAVVLTHFSSLHLIITGHANEPDPLYFLASGVDLFFVISGFIMVYSSRALFAIPGGRSSFLIKRLTRIIPLYWLTTLIAIPMEQLTFDWRSLSASLLFWPYAAPSGAIVPLFGIGWTLNYEMFFYGLFALALAWPRKVAAPLLCVGLVILAALGYWLSPQWAPLRFWLDPIVIEFALGIGLAVLYRSPIVIPFAVRFAMIGAAISVIYLSAHLIPGAGSLTALRWLLWGVPAALIFAGVTLGKRQQPLGIVAWAFKNLGDASYAIYLIHSLVASSIIVLWQRGLNTYEIPTVMVGGVILTVLLSLALYRLFERPTTRALQILLSPRPPLRR